jgi:hypothetical protein
MLEQMRGKVMNTNEKQLAIILAEMAKIVADLHTLPERVKRFQPDLMNKAMDFAAFALSTIHKSKKLSTMEFHKLRDNSEEAEELVNYMAGIAKYTIKSMNNAGMEKSIGGFIEHLNDGLRIAKENAEDFAKIIRFEDEPEQKLKSKYNLSEKQVEYIFSIDFDCL